MKEKRKYEKPSMRVFDLKQRQQLLQASGQKRGGQMDDPDDYLREDDPFQF